MNKSREIIATVVGLMLVAAGGISYSPVAAAQSDAGAVLEEIIVTAQKREQTLAEIPMSITVLSGDLLQRQQADNFQDLLAMVPGLSIDTGTRGLTRITLRGINTGGVASTVGVYVDDVPFGSSSGLANAAILSGDFDTFDLARVEVLRGPQGTLYGASSLGGVLKYVPNRASTDGFEAKIQGSIEGAEEGGAGYALTGVLNVPANDQFAIRVSGFYRADDGFIDSIGNNPIASLTDPVNNAVDGTIDEDNINSLDTYGGRLSALFEPSDRFSLHLTAMMQDINSDAPNIVDANPNSLQPLNSTPVQSRYQNQYNDSQYRLYGGSIDWDFGGASLQSITSYGTFEQDTQQDIAIGHALTGGIDLAAFLTFLFGDPVTNKLSATLPQTVTTDKFTQELRLLSPDSDKFEWLFGVYYTDEDSALKQDIFAVNAGTDTPAAGLPALAVVSLDSDYEELAFFANATWYITPAFELSFGARASDNDQVATQRGDGPLAGGPTLFENLKSSESPFTWSVSPRFKLGDDASVYARVATGFRPGGPNVLPPSAPPDTPATYDSDTLTSYEVGLKSSGSDGKFSLDVTVFYLDWEDIQLLAVVNNFGINANGGTAVSKGLEFTAAVYPTDGLSLSFNGAYTDAYLTQNTDPIVGGADGDPLSFVPDWSFGLNGDYEWSVMGDSTAYAGGTVGYTGDRPADFNNRAANGSIRELESYVTVNLRAGIDTGRWTFEVYGKNLTDEEGVTTINDVGALPNGAVGLGIIRPRTFGMTVGVSF